jgi:branched-chain amino acid transport system substrate-binding protein
MADESTSELTAAVKIVSSLTRSGSSRGQSDSVVNSIHLCLDDWNWRVGGAKILYEDLDDGSEEHGSWVAEREVANARYAASDTDCLAYIGTLDADAAPYSIPILNEAGPLLMISPCNSYPGLTKKVPWAPDEPDKYYPTGKRNYCRTALSDDVQALGAAQWAWELGVRRIYVLHDTERYGYGVAEPFASACARLRIEVVGGGTEAIPEARGFGALAQKIAASGADTTFYGGIIQSGAGRLWSEVKSACPGMRMMAADAIFERAFLADAEGAAEGTLITFGGVPPAHLSGPGASFYVRYKQIYGTEPESYAASTYDAVSVVLSAIERVARKDRAAVCEEVFATRDYHGLLGRWSFDANGDITLRKISRISVERGDFTFLESVDAPEDTFLPPISSS